MSTCTCTATQLSDDPIVRRARDRVAVKLGFLVHLVVFTAVNFGMFLMTEMLGVRGWIHMPLWGWGIGLVIHGAVTLIRLLGEGTHERLLGAEIARLRERS
ncbi:2TM domain-containing protein [Ideonella sp. DXS29W]|uniref:2TM domain-containing protein n=1 Tax=Ideonella lacteola TaxID=2984193 RepID=A0ABU9BVM6_9BURK